MTDDVVAFLRAAHEEIERVARAAIEDTDSAEWVTLPEPDDLIVRVGASMTDQRVFGFGSAAHISLHDPRSALARVQAECRLMDDLIRTQAVWFLSETPEANGAAQRVAKTIAEATFRLLAYGHRHTVPGYDPAWNPEGVEVGA